LPPSPQRRNIAAGHPVRDIECKITRLAAGGADFRNRLGGRLAVDVEDRERRALAREAEHNGMTDAGTRPGDDGNMIVQEPVHL
jgi:hypothetical protein